MGATRIRFLAGAAALAGCNAITGAADLLVVADDDIGIDGGSADDSSPLKPDGGSDTSSTPPSKDADTEAPPADAEPDGPSEPGIKRVFVSSTTMPANMGGLSGADAKCNELAQAAGLGGTFVAWLSTDKTSAKDRVTGAGPWNLVGDSEVAVTRAPTTNLSLAKAIRRTETGALVSGFVWTATFSDGSFLDDDCADWTSQSGVNHAPVGDSKAVDDMWTAARPVSCKELYRIYCFQL